MIQNTAAVVPDAPAGVERMTTFAVRLPVVVLDLVLCNADR